MSNVKVSDGESGEERKNNLEVREDSQTEELVDKECVVENRDEIVNEQEEGEVSPHADAGCKVSNGEAVTNESPKQNLENKDTKSSYVHIAKSNLIDNKLTRIPTEIDGDGSEFVIFDEEIVNEGSKKWENEIGVQSVIQNGLWMVNGKPMFVQKWDPSSNKGISAIASRLGTPLIMDNVTTNMCKMGTGRLGFARVLIEVEAEKGLPSSIDIVYKDGKNVVIGKKIVQVQYDWVPPMCSFCHVFGHNDKMCEARPRTDEEKKEME
ncbi:RNA-directed DNA polymerase, eukaryota, reverse transcriptase zinc-binding domain protein, partial [Tanacetum coccineum]